MRERKYPFDLRQKTRRRELFRRCHPNRGTESRDEIDPISHAQYSAMVRALLEAEDSIFNTSDEKLDDIFPTFDEEFHEISTTSDKELDADSTTRPFGEHELNAESNDNPEPFLVTCKCGAKANFKTLHAQNDCEANGLACLACKEHISIGRLVFQLEIQIRAYINKYYEGWIRCSNKKCQKRTRMMSVYGKQCISCQNAVSYEYSNQHLYTQLRYFQCLFDEDLSRSVAGTEISAAAHGVFLDNMVLLRALKQSVNKYLDYSAHQLVDLASLFSYMEL